MGKEREVLYHVKNRNWSILAMSVEIMWLWFASTDYRDQSGW